MVPVLPPQDSLPAIGTAILRDVAGSYSDAARWVNERNCDVVLVQHEFGIYGGIDGYLLLDFTRNLKVPYAVTFHTVLPAFSTGQAADVAELCRGADAVTVFTATARRLMLDQNLAGLSAIQVVAHGAPSELYREASKSDLAAELGLSAGAQIVSTFGLLSKGKGIELAIEAVSQLAADFPDLRYVIAGRSHPEVVRREGERYRDLLRKLVERPGVQDRVVFLDRFLSIDELADLLAQTEVFLTPYRGEDQIVSGALTFALAAGCPAVSTPYRYACDVLADGAGIVVGFDDVEGFSAAMARLLRAGPERASAVAAAVDASRSMAWPTVGRSLYAPCCRMPR